MYNVLESAKCSGEEQADEVGLLTHKVGGKGLAEEVLSESRS